MFLGSGLESLLLQFSVPTGAQRSSERAFFEVTHGKVQLLVALEAIFSSARDLSSNLMPLSGNFFSLNCHAKQLSALLVFSQKGTCSILDTVQPVPLQWSALLLREPWALHIFQAASSPMCFSPAANFALKLLRLSQLPFLHKGIPSCNCNWGVS